MRYPVVCMLVCMLEEEKQQGLNFDIIYFALVSCCFVMVVVTVAMLSVNDVSVGFLLMYVASCCSARSAAL
jgi:hypothetical protein